MNNNCPRIDPCETPAVISEKAHSWAVWTNQKPEMQCTISHNVLQEQIVRFYKAPLYYYEKSQ